MDNNVQQSVVAILSRRPEVVETGPFVIGWDPTTDSRNVSYATPRPGAAVTADDVAALVAAFRAIDRIPRLEYVPGCCPELESLLLAAGFAIEARHTYLACTPATLAPLPVPDGFELIEPSTDEEHHGGLSVQNEAFGGEATATPADVERAARTQRNGGVVLAIRTTTGEYAAAGLASPPGAGLVEVAGIATAERFRRRGLAAALTAELAATAFRRGAQGAWLEAESPVAGRVYERVGFVPSGQRLYIALD
ncbi:ribosomal protein S18 acetylase RimI-like enzyme [Allocatelliglobosispora scoriae]|uniref:Ribosomal protein S18 acetylase RimI-like enzyme n=1 Tax=Allocatelliglobosispora scoriae TaxID=643052 RepID=A0A841C428_9ACTN|nr:GNAT family N-acetyltransferase [Allocatelliglobosispora scoriae]MBB5873720.1 ribosomal protein S18 acetylase RimI-like enzyme [Allocatelliglobosispora scoriae]